MAIVFVDGKEVECEKSGAVSDGFHTFDELYDHRCLLYINLCLAKPDKAVWMPDGPNWFLLYLEMNTGQISYHLPMKFLPLVDGKIKRQDNYPWDKHKSADVLKRLTSAAHLHQTAVTPEPWVVPESVKIVDPHERCEHCGASVLGFHGCHD